MPLIPCSFFHCHTNGVTDGQTDRQSRPSTLNAPTLSGRGHNKRIQLPTRPTFDISIWCGHDLPSESTHTHTERERERERDWM